MLGSFTNSWGFIRLAHVRPTALWISVFNTVFVFALFIPLCQADPVKCVAEFQYIRIKISAVSFNPLEFWSKQLSLHGERKYSAGFYLFLCSALRHALPNSNSIGWKQSTSTLLSFSCCYSSNVFFYDCLSGCLSQCRHNDSVHNRRVPSFGLRCQIDIASVLTVISVGTETSEGSEKFLHSSMNGITRQFRVLSSESQLLWPCPCQLPTLLVRKIYCCPSTQKKKKKTLLEINVAAQCAFTMALWSIYIENTIKLSQEEKRKPHVPSVWSPRSPGTSIASLFSALLWSQIILQKKIENMTLYPLTLGLLVFSKTKLNFFFLMCSL